MTESTYTPGPWQATKWANGFEISAPDEHYTIAKLSGCNNAENNARLIASAPELLEALRAMLEMTTDNRTHGKEIYRACAVIQEAEGQS
jgi:hypothetical protein